MAGDAYGPKNELINLDGEQYFWKSSAKAWILTILVVIDLVVIVVYFVRSVDALRRLARPLYYMHPAQTRGRLRPYAYG